ncbi:MULTISPECIES: energy-coupling factor ABC transporter substrate-binding protein [unclassified Dietzia]|uniref:energy-coupling factor ABC transporter substrate-binding protein n=1 Tax=unclassified Dietzia TaxID=2617939 RepID=UPI0015FE1E24|nr:MULTISPECIES: energy-coupling factor ABC transporter substrate-binding protein [unclassified Dietzia]MBB1023167.1 energy-coupling factor ABC transporter substrate-binding protein [Dietzia sp. DQ12-76]MBB1026558.1 energy-coupling factor ABC transporter substrate-binding protein [Dietzia sp. DQ11-38-2]
MSGRKHVSVWVLVGLVAVAFAITVLSLVYGAGAGGEFEGADGQAEGAISEVSPDYEPWFEPLLPELPGEVESGVFALQAGIGGGIVGYGLGVLRTRSRQRRESVPGGATPSAAATGSTGH